MIPENNIIPGNNKISYQSKLQQQLIRGYEHYAERLLGGSKVVASTTLATMVHTYLQRI